MKRREMLRAGFSKAALVLPLALAAGGSLGRLLAAGAGLLQAREVGAFPSGKAKGAVNSQKLTKEEEE